MSRLGARPDLFISRAPPSATRETYCSETKMISQFSHYLLAMRNNLRLIILYTKHGT